MFVNRKTKKELKKNAPTGAEWVTEDGRFYYKIVDNAALMYASIGQWVPSAQRATDIQQSPFFIKL